jgi:hypothetical protein
LKRFEALFLERAIGFLKKFSLKRGKRERGKRELTGSSRKCRFQSISEEIKLDNLGKVQLETAAQETVEGEVCGPVRIQIEGFRPIYNEVLFLDMKPENGEYEPLIGYVILEQSRAAVDMLGHRLVPVKRMDLK